MHLKSAQFWQIIFRHFYLELSTFSYRVKSKDCLAIGTHFHFSIGRIHHFASPLEIEIHVNLSISEVTNSFVFHSFQVILRMVFMSKVELLFQLSFSVSEFCRRRAEKSLQAFRKISYFSQSCWMEFDWELLSESVPLPMAFPIVSQCSGQDCRNHNVSFVLFNSAQFAISWGRRRLAIIS